MLLLFHVKYPSRFHSVSLIYFLNLPGCQQNCTCENGAQCDKVDGSCTCIPGWLGGNCDIPCDTGFYGVNCSMTCQCDNGGVCDAETGRYYTPIMVFLCHCKQICVYAASDILIRVGRRHQKSKLFNKIRNKTHVYCRLFSEIFYQKT